MRPPTRLLLPLLLLLPGCDEEDAVSIHVRLQDDLSGVLTTHSLTLPSLPGPLEEASRAVSWSSRIDLVSAVGGFERLSDVDLAGITFAAGSEGGLNFLVVTLPRGEGAVWTRGFAPLELADPDRRQILSRALDPDAKEARLGTTLKLTIILPGEVIAHGAVPRNRRLKEDVEGMTATLVVPLRMARKEGDPIVWQLTWS